MKDLDKKKEIAKKMMHYLVAECEEQGLDPYDSQECLSLALIAGFSVLNFSTKDFTEFLRYMRESFIKLQGGR